MCVSVATNKAVDVSYVKKEQVEAAWSSFMSVATNIVATASYIG